jgi:hypothetical protein
VTVSDTNVAVVTVTPVDPDTPTRVAVTAALPTPVPLTSPLLFASSLTDATELLLEVQLTSVVQSWVLPSLKLQVPSSGTSVPLTIDGLVGVTVIEVNFASVTVTAVEPWMPLSAAIMGVLPPAKAVTSPWLPETLLTCAVTSTAEVQLT